MALGERDRAIEALRRSVDLEPEEERYRRALDAALASPDPS